MLNTHWFHRLAHCSEPRSRATKQSMKESLCGANPLKSVTRAKFGGWLVCHTVHDQHARNGYLLLGVRATISAKLASTEIIGKLMRPLAVRLPWSEKCFFVRCWRGCAHSIHVHLALNVTGPCPASTSTCSLVRTHNCVSGHGGGDGRWQLRAREVWVRPKPGDSSAPKSAGRR